MNAVQSSVCFACPVHYPLPVSCHLYKKQGMKTNHSPNQLKWSCRFPHIVRMCGKKMMGGWGWTSAQSWCRNSAPKYPNMVVRRSRTGVCRYPNARNNLLKTLHISHCGEWPGNSITHLGHLKILYEQPSGEKLGLAKACSSEAARPSGTAPVHRIGFRVPAAQTVLSMQDANWVD